MKSPCCLSVSPPLITFEQFFLDNHEIQEGGHDIKSDFEAISFNLVASRISKFMTL
jgi:hypothetical protein